MSNEDNRNEYSDLDDIMNASNDEDGQENKPKGEMQNKTPEQKKKDRKRKNQNADFENATQSHRDKSKNKFSIWKFFKKYILQVLIGLIVGLILGIIMFSGSSSQDDNNQVYEVDKSVSLEDQIDNVRSSQIDAIRQQFNALRDSSEDGGNLSGEEDKVAKANANASKNLDPFLKEVMNTPLNPTDKELQARTNKLKDLSTTENEEKNFDTSAIDNLLKGNSASKELNEAGVKSGATFPTLVGVDKKLNDVYLTMTPFTTNNKTVNVLYLIKANSDGKFVTGTYIGYIQSSDKNRAKDVYSYLSNSLKGDVNADQVNKEIVNVKPSDTTQENTSTKPEDEKVKQQEVEKAKQQEAEKAKQQEAEKAKQQDAKQKKEKSNEQKKDDKK